MEFKKKRFIRNNLDLNCEENIVYNLFTFRIGPISNLKDHKIVGLHD